jgi:hypothetical protein
VVQGQKADVTIRSDIASTSRLGGFDAIASRLALLSGHGQQRDSDHPSRVVSVSKINADGLKIQ